MVHFTLLSVGIFFTVFFYYVATLNKDTLFPTQSHLALRNNH